VLHYDRNLGKGYAVKAGALAAHGEWIGLVDSDLDLDPAAVPVFLDVARRQGLDLAIGSKRHPESAVHYPRSRRVGSWGYQQLIRLLFGLHVHDTQVGLKVFSRAVAEEVMPLLMVKRFAFDLELLAVSHALGYSRVRELPIRLDYRFTGSGVRSMAVVRALWDTAAVFYRLRLLRTYQRKKALLGDLRRARTYRPVVTLIADGDVELDYPELERRESLGAAAGDVVARAAPGCRPAGNWVSAAVPFLAIGDVSAVVCPALAPPGGSVRQRAGAAVLESRLGGGSRRMRSLPGNLRVVSDYPGATIVARRIDLEAAQSAGVTDDSVVAWLAGRNRRTVYTPETVVVTPPPPAVGPVVRSVRRDAVARGRIARATRGRSLGLATGLSLLPMGLAVTAVPLVAVGGIGRRAGAALVVVYAAVLGTSAVLGGLRFRSARVGALTLPTLLAAQVAYVVGFAQGVGGRSRKSQA
jgi:hypothetical protein